MSRQELRDVRELVQQHSELSTVELISHIKGPHIQGQKKYLSRKPNAVLERLINTVCPELEDQVKTIEIGDDEEDSTVTDQVLDRTVNKSITNGWNIPPATGTTAAVDSGSAKRKERPLSKNPKAKRPRVEEDREPPKNVSLADLGGVDSCINEIKDMVILPLKHPEVYTHIGVATPRGVLLHGPPGCGKTLLANAVAGEIGVPFISVSAPSLVSGMSGESEKKVRELFEEAKQLAPCLMFIDEIDAVTPKRENAQREMERRIVAQLLTCMDDMSLEKTNGKPVLIIGATNRPDSLDPALRRAGRFDREICMGVPDERSREQILSVLCRSKKLSGTMDLKVLAKRTPGFVGADLEALTTAAGVVAIKRIFKTLQDDATQQDLLAGATEGDSIMLDGNETDIQAPLKTPASDLANDTTAAKATASNDFLSAHSKSLSEADLAPFSIDYADFLVALPKIQPSSKREGFTTVPDVTWQDIGALHPIRAELQMAIVRPISRPDIFLSVGITAPAGVLLWGPPGCGKTLLAKAVANESRANFISVRGPELLNKYVGESERAVRQVFVRARASAPCIIFFDELDALVPRRDDSLSESSARVVNTLLTELDGLGDRNGVFVIAATNRPDMIDPAMMRPGRLDKQLFVQLPSLEERAEILKTLTRNKPTFDATIDFVGIARDARCNFFSGADLASLVREAANAALRNIFDNVLDNEPSRHVEEAKSGPIVTQEHFEQAFDKVKPSVTEAERSKYEKLLKKLT